MTKGPQDADVEFIQALADLLRNNDLSEIEVNRERGEDQSLTVRLTRAATVSAAAVQVAPPAAPSVAPSAHPPTPSTAPSGPPPALDPSDDPGVIPSPMVGTAYLQPEPGAPAFIRIGDTVSEGETILIIEAMKTMNQIHAPRSGRVKRILVEDGSPVEFGAPLIILE